MQYKHQYALQLQTINMDLDNDSRALLVKLFYQNNNNSSAALLEYRLRIRRDPLSIPGLNIIRRFELTGDLGIAPARGRRPIAPEIVEVTVAIVENAGRNVRSSLLDDHKLRPSFSALATATSISGAIGYRSLAGAIPKSPVKSNLRIMFFNPGTER